MSELMTFSYTRQDLSLLPRRPAESNKGTFGRVLCVCGSKGMAGAAYLCAKATLRCGAGLVEIFTPEENRIVLQTLLPEAIVTTYDADEPQLHELERAVSRATAIVCGCGLGTSRQASSILGRVLRSSSVPTVLDADALNILSRNAALMKYAKGKIITPHLYEMSRLTRIDAEQIAAEATTVCQSFAQSHELVCVLKGHRTAVSDGGASVYINRSGNSGMSTAGAGDVLAGVIGGILAQNRDGALSEFQVASLGVYIHGLSGDAAAEMLGEYSVIASDIIDCLPKILKHV